MLFTAQIKICNICIINAGDNLTHNYMSYKYSIFCADLLKVPPGFSSGLLIEAPVKTLRQEPVAVADMLFSDDQSLLNWTEQDNKQDEVCCNT